MMILINVIHFAFDNENINRCVCLLFNLYSKFSCLYLTRRASKAHHHEPKESTILGVKFGGRNNHLCRPGRRRRGWLAPRLGLLWWNFDGHQLSLSMGRTSYCWFNLDAKHYVSWSLLGSARLGQACNFLINTTLIILTCQTDATYP